MSNIEVEIDVASEFRYRKIKFNKKNLYIFVSQSGETADTAAALQLCKDNNVDILPVDSEHSAIYQCLLGEKNKNIEKIILTASGGPFRGKSIEDLKYIKKEDALNHPNWDMGNKISIDSSTLMNKGLEVIEAKYLFDIDINSIEVVVHPQSIIHSMVEFNDGSIKAQMGEPDMKLPIQFALGYPERLTNNFKKFK